MENTQALDQSQPGLSKRVKKAIERQQLSQRTEQSYLHWITRFITFHDCQDPEMLAEEEQHAFLRYLDERAQVSRARLNQAKQALVFFYEDVLDKVESRDTAAA
ncbi:MULTISPECIES: site-specific integrase [Marinobacter]|uniref:Site-specific integrase n=1 Tax=Marinobacter suaedae TaxID=3057675 RepID=A0ABT8VZ65_9GAMM|nr:MULTISPECIES: site-specific integrase [unclassified Marinobacter]MBZ2169358.1 phage integrase N-terminal SAM-like domain-containing protein [Marinobacter sp. F4216]MDO3721223.1 site-specific integrase [Marinobacter sp. chi1]